MRERPDGSIEPLEILTFDLDSTALDPTSVTELDVLASWMKQYPEQHVVIEGTSASAAASWSA